MLTFIVPLKSAQCSSSWDLVCKLLERTLRSIFQQTCSDFNAIVVCHEKPQIAFEHDRLTYLSVDLPLPEADMQSKERDKMHKMRAGLIQANAGNSSHVMFVDADDCVSKQLAKFVNQHSPDEGWYVGQGYQYRSDIQRLTRRNKNLQRRTNSSHIIGLGSTHSLQLDQLEAGHPILWHLDTFDFFKQQGTPLKPLPFPGVIHIIDTGENMWWSQDEISSRFAHYLSQEALYYYAGKLHQKLISRPLTDGIRDEFGLYDIF